MYIADHYGELINIINHYRDNNIQVNVNCVISGVIGHRLLFVRLVKRSVTPATHTVNQQRAAEGRRTVTAVSNMWTRWMEPQWRNSCLTSASEK